MTREELAASIAAIALLKAQLVKVDGEYRAALNEILRVGATEPAYLGDVRIAKVLKKEGSLTASVTDPEALLAWVQQERPDEVVSRLTVRDMHVSHLKDRAKEGEIIPGIELREGSPTLALSQLDRAAFPLVLDAIRSGHLSIESLPAITEGA